MRAPESDTAARSSTFDELIGLLLLRQSSLLGLTPDHPHRDAIRQARDNAQAEMKWRVSVAREHHEVAALLALSLDMLAENADSTNLKEMVLLAKSDKEEIVSNPTVRSGRYQAAAALFNL